jgi:7-carboxy-7-deazaguanine synthase
MRIAEIFYSIQGEGRLTGTRSAFVRASGCNLRCAYCDTPYASWMPEGEDLSVDEIAARVDEFNCTHIVITGGEPMMYAELIPLCAALRRQVRQSVGRSGSSNAPLPDKPAVAPHGGQTRHITIETAGTLYLPVECDLMSISPKLSNSSPSADGDPRWTWRHELNRHAPEVIRRLVAEYDYQVKFVVGNFDDCSEAERFLADFPEIDRARAMLMPQGTDAADLAEKALWLEPYCREHALGFCPRRHIEWFGSRRGT